MSITLQRISEHPKIEDELASEIISAFISAQFQGSRATGRSLRSRTAPQNPRKNCRSPPVDRKKKRSVQVPRRYCRQRGTAALAGSPGGHPLSERGFSISRAAALLSAATPAGRAVQIPASGQRSVPSPSRGTDPRSPTPRGGRAAYEKRPGDRGGPEKKKRSSQKIPTTTTVLRKMALLCLT